MSLGVVPEHERSAQRQRGCVGSQVVILPQFVRSAAIGSHQRISLIAIIPIAAGAFVATNLDNFILLVALLARYRNHTSNVIAGYFAGVLSLGFVGLWIGKAANIAPVEYIGLLALCLFPSAPLSLFNYSVVGQEQPSPKKTSYAFTKTFISGTGVY